MRRFIRIIAMRRPRRPLGALAGCVNITPVDARHVAASGHAPGENVMKHLHFIAMRVSPTSFCSTLAQARSYTQLDFCQFSGVMEADSTQ